MLPYAGRQHRARRGGHGFVSAIVNAEAGRISPNFELKDQEFIGSSAGRLFR
jgi:hypothetical protein